MEESEGLKFFFNVRNFGAISGSLEFSKLIEIIDASAFEKCNTHVDTCLVSNAFPPTKLLPRVCLPFRYPMPDLGNPKWVSAQPYP